MVNKNNKVSDITIDPISKFESNQKSNQERDTKNGDLVKFDSKLGSENNGYADNVDDKQSDKEIKKIAEKESPKGSFRDLYRYAQWLDYVLLIVGISLSLAQGALNSIQAIIFKDLSNSLIIGQVNWTLGIFNDQAFYNGAMSAIYMYTGYGAGIFVMSTISMCCWFTLCERQSHQIRKHFLAAALRQNMGWYDTHESGELSTKMSDGIDRIKDGIGDKMGILFTYGAAFISGIIVAFSISWRMTLIMLAFVPILAGLTGFLTQFLSTSVKKELQAYEKAGAIAEEVVLGIKTVIALNGQQMEIDRYDSKLSEASKFGIKKAFYIAFGTAWLFCLIFVAMGVAFWYGTILYIDKLIEPGAVFATFWAIIGGTMSLGMAAPQIGVIMAARNAASSLFEVIDREPEINCESPEGSTMNDLKGDIEFRDVHFRYPSRPDEEVLQGVTFKVNANQSVAIVGASGCGKSTTLGLLLRYYNQTMGELTIDGVAINQFNIRWLRSVIGVVSQEPVLFSATIEDNLRLGCESMTAEDMERVCKMANAHKFIKDLPQGYKTRIGEGGIQLSGGQKQRIAIARALARNPKILLLDEATSALDTESEKIVQLALDKASYGRTTLTIAHRLSTIRNADRIIVLDHGKIIEEGTHDELMALGGVYMQSVRAQDIEKVDKHHALQEEDDASTMAFDDISDMMHRKPSRLLSRLNSLESADYMSRRMSRAQSTSSAILERELKDMKEEAHESKVADASILTILKFARAEWPVLSFALLSAISMGLIFPIFSIIYGQMFKALARPSNAAKLAGARDNAIYFTILGVGAGIVTFFGGFLFGYAGESLTKRLRIALFANIVKQDGEFFDTMEHASGKLVTRLATDTPNIRAAIDQRFSNVVQGVTAIVAGIGIAFFYGPKMAPIGILTSACLMLVQVLIAQYLKKRTERDLKDTQEPSRLATEAIEHHQTVQYLTSEKHFYDSFNLQMRKPHYQALQRGIVQAFSFSLHACFIFFNFAAAYRYGVWLVMSRNSTPYIIFQVIEALNIASMSLLAIGTYFPEYIRARLSASMVFHMLDEKPKIDSLAVGGKQIELEGEVRLEDVHFAYRINQRNPVLKGVNLDALKGKTVALVGPSGCGKSTVVQLLERFYDPLSGKVMYDNELCNQLNLQKLRSQISIVSQEPTLFNYSIRDNITYGLTNVSQNDIEEAAKLANAHKFIEEMNEGYNTSVGEKGSRLSGGQKQRVAIARAIVRKPKVLLLDEATSALDSESEKVVQEALDRARSGRTCIVIAHRLSSIQTSDTILVIKNGIVIEKGNHQDLLHINGLYARLTEMQNLD